MLSEGSVKDSVLRVIDSMRKWKRIDFSTVFTEELSMPEFTILNGIERIKNNHDTVYVSDIAHLFSMSAQAVSKYLKICESRGFVIRETDRRDRRNTKLFLTEKGRGVLAQCESELIDFMSSVFGEFDSRDIARLMELADEIYDKTVKKLEQSI